ncbi:MAG: ATP synthase F0 subunit A [Balneola sp.]|jgi:F-type H+-transporting ATPase subunit a|nr:ATP synthase F0 subunit A [Balneola sp.]MBE79873.1 ATP synthase F0 subunit A [Balneola sp.]HBX66951.1 ATP synthase F0 subunit A [Balneolaceae bacterium]|tara:strand:- start:109 stop:1182 length:1074 start_codon:yes stop_codon:yes gene_type:complete
MIQTLRRVFLTLLFLSISTSNTFAADQAEGEEEPIIDVMGTVLDHDYFKTPFGKIYLPRIFYWEDAEGQAQLSAFASTKKAVASENFELSEAGAVVPVNGGHISLDLSITSHLIYFWLSIGLVLFITIGMSRKYKNGIGKDTEPQGAFQNTFEVLFQFVRDDIAKDNIRDDKYERYVPYLFSVFMGIAFMNLFGLLPWAATATADLTVTATLAIITFLITQFSGTKDHWAHVFWFPGVPGWTRFILTPVEVLGLFTKPFALAIRLFANMLSGKMMIIAILGLIFIFADLFGPIGGYGMAGLLSVPLTAALYFLKAFVALLQAYVFTILSAVFIGMAAEDHEHDEEGYHAEHIAEQAN